MSTISLSSNAARLKNPAAVQAILNRYYIEPHASVKDGRLTFSGDDSQALAVPISWLPPEPIDDDEWGIPDDGRSDHAERLEDFLLEHGTAGFFQLLREISRHLESTLVVLNEWVDPRGLNDVEPAIAYVVEPGSLDVEVFCQEDLEWDEIIALLDDELELNVVYKAIPPGWSPDEGIFAILLGEDAKNHSCR